MRYSRLWIAVSISSMLFGVWNDIGSSSCRVCAELSQRNPPARGTSATRGDGARAGSSRRLAASLRLVRSCRRPRQQLAGVTRPQNDELVARARGSDVEERLLTLKRFGAVGLGESLEGER